METMEICGRKFDILDHVIVDGAMTVPVLNIRMMDDQRERELAAMSAAAWKGVASA